MSTGLPDAPAAREALRRVLSTAFSARDLADPLLPLEASLPAGQAREAMAERSRTVSGWRTWRAREPAGTSCAPSAPSRSSPRRPPCARWCWPWAVETPPSSGAWAR